MNFQLNGEVILNASNPLQINVDLNPFVLLNGLTMENIKDLGYINITLDGAEVAPINGRTILTLHCDFSTGRLIVNLTSPGSNGLLSAGLMGGPEHLYFAGIYDLESIPAIISRFGGAAQTVAFADEDSSSDNFLMDLVETLISNIDVSNLTENGLVIKDLRATISKLVDTLLPDFASIKPGNSVSDLLLVEGNNDIVIKFNAENGFVYGGCERVEETDLDLYNFSNPDLALSKPGTKATTDAYKATLQYGERFTLFTKTDTHRRMFPINVTTMDGVERTIDAIYSFHTGYDPLKIGKQTVTVYYGLPTKLTKVFSSMLLGGMLPGMLDINLPLYGAQSLQVEVKVVPPGIAGSEMIILKSTEMETGSNVADILNGTLRYTSGNGNPIECKITSNMIFSKTPILDSNGNILYNGTWKIEVRRVAADGTIVASCPITITSFGLQADSVDVAYVGDNIADLFNFSKTIYDNKGNLITERVDIKVAKATYINSLGTVTNISISSLFESGTTILKYNRSADNKVITLTVEATIDGVKYTRFVNFTLRRSANYFILATGRDTSQITSTTKVDSLKANFVIATGADDVEWGVRYNLDTNVWELSRPVTIKDENGNDVVVVERLMKEYDLQVEVTRTRNSSNQSVNEVVDMSELVDGCLSVGTYKFAVTLNGASFTRSNVQIKLG